MGSATDISVVIPLYCEERNISELYSRLTNSLRPLTEDYEILFVNDGSNDGTLPLLKGFAANNSKVKYISLSRNFGHQNAIAAGLKHATGNVIVTMDGDLQDPPELIPELYSKHKEGYKVVYARRRSRQGESFFKKSTARFFYRLLRRITSIDIPLDTGDFRIISREVVDHLNSQDEANRFFRGQIAWMGFKTAAVEFERLERKHGETKFTLSKMLRFAFDGITSFSNFPLQIASFLGITFSIVAFVTILYALYAKFILEEVITGWTSLMISVLFIGGIQLLCIGIIGEYISRIASDVKKRPSFIIEESNLHEKSKYSSIPTNETL